MSNLTDRIFVLIQRHKIAFSVSLTLFLIGVFSGIFYSVGGTKEDAQLVTEVARTPSFFALIFSVVIPNAICLLILYLSGLYKISAISIVPIVIIFKGYDTGAMLIKSLSGFIGFIECILIFLPLAIAYFVIFVFGGMVSLCSSSKRSNYDPSSYNNFFVILLIIDGLACLYYAIIKWLFGFLGL